MQESMDVSDAVPDVEEEKVQKIPAEADFLYAYSTSPGRLWIFFVNLFECSLHYITLSAFQTPPTPKVTSGASTITCYTKYSPPAQHAG